MRTTLVLPEALVDEARAATGFTSKTETVVFALRELVRRKRIDELKTLMRTVSFEFDPTTTRRRDRARVNSPRT